MWITRRTDYAARAVLALCVADPDELLNVEDIAGGVQSTYAFSFECEGATKPSCVAEVIFRSYA